MSHEPFDTQAASYALGALDGEERAQFEAHLARGCAECSAAVRDFGETLADLAREAPATIPPAHVKTALMNRVTATATSRARTYRARRFRRVAIIAASIIGVSVFSAGFVASRYEARIGFLARETAAVRADLRRQEAALRSRVAEQQAVIDLLRDPATRVVALNGLPAAPGANGRVIWHEKVGGRLYVANLPAPPPGKAYELWTIGTGQPRPAGVFTVDSSGSASHPVAPAPDPVQVFAVTLEPEGGVPAPTGPMVLASAK